MTQTATGLARFEHEPAILLTSFKRDGTPVPTVVSIAVDGDRAYIRTYERAGKTKRIRRHPQVEIRPSTMTGRPTGEPIRAHARLLRDAEAERASRLLAAKHRWLHGFLVPLAHRLRRDRTIHFALEL